MINEIETQDDNAGSADLRSAIEADVKSTPDTPAPVASQPAPSARGGVERVEVEQPKWDGGAPPAGGPRPRADAAAAADDDVVLDDDDDDDDIFAEPPAAPAPTPAGEAPHLSAASAAPVEVDEDPAKIDESIKAALGVLPAPVATAPVVDVDAAIERALERVTQKLQPRAEVAPAAATEEVDPEVANFRREVAKALGVEPGEFGAFLREQRDQKKRAEMEAANAAAQAEFQALIDNKLLTKELTRAGYDLARWNRRAREATAVAYAEAARQQKQFGTREAAAAVYAAYEDVMAGRKRSASAPVPTTQARAAAPAAQAQTREMAPPPDNVVQFRPPAYTDGRDELKSLFADAMNSTPPLQRRAEVGPRR